MRRNAAMIGEFLKARRRQFVRADLGLPAIAARRTFGLRREEVAYLVGVSVTWYTRLEQGCDITRSWQVLERLEIHEGHQSIFAYPVLDAPGHEESRLVAILLVAAPLSPRGQRSVN